MPDLLTDEDVGLSPGLSDADVGLGPASMPPIALSPYEKAKLAGGENISGPFGPANPAEVLALPQALSIPASLIQKSGIPDALEDIGSDFLRRTGINPSAQAGVPLAPKREDETYIPSPLEEAFPNATRGAEEALRSFTTPGQSLLAPFAGLKPVQTLFEAQMAAGVPGSVDELYHAQTPEDAAKALVNSGLGLAAGARLLRGHESAESLNGNPGTFNFRQDRPLPTVSVADLSENRGLPTAPESLNGNVLQAELVDSPQTKLIEDAIQAQQPGESNANQIPGRVEIPSGEQTGPVAQVAEGKPGNVQEAPQETQLAPEAQAETTKEEVTQTAPPAAITEGETPTAPAVSKAVGEPAPASLPEPAITESNPVKSDQQAVDKATNLTDAQIGLAPAARRGRKAKVPLVPPAIVAPVQAPAPAVEKVQKQVDKVATGYRGADGQLQAKAIKSEMVANIENHLTKLIADNDDDSQQLQKSVDGKRWSYGSAWFDVEKTPTGYSIKSGVPSVFRTKTGKQAPSVSGNFKTLQEAEWFAKAVGSTGKGKVTFKIPGDGDMTVFNHGPALVELLQRAKKIEVTQGRSKAPSVGGGAVDADELAEAAKKIYGDARNAIAHLETQLASDQELDPATRIANERAVQLMRDELPEGIMARMVEKQETQLADAHAEVSKIQAKIAKLQKLPPNRKKLTYAQERTLASETSKLARALKQAEQVQKGADELYAKQAALAKELKVPVQTVPKATPVAAPAPTPAAAVVAPPAPAPRPKPSPPKPVAQSRSLFDPKEAKDQKKFLLAEIDKAIKEAPAASTGNWNDKNLQDDYNAAVMAASGEPQRNSYGYTPADLQRFADDSKAWREQAGGKLQALLEKYKIPASFPGSAIYKTADGTTSQRYKPETYTAKERGEMLRAKINELDAAQIPRVTIDVPGAGTYQIRNTKEALEAFKEKAKSFPTTSPRPGKASAPRATPTAPLQLGKQDTESALKAAGLAVSDQPTRKILNYLYSDGSVTIGVDGRRLNKVDVGLPGASPKGSLFSVEGEKLTEAEQKEAGEFPSYEQVIPKNPDLIFKGVDTAGLFNAVKQAAQTVGTKASAVKLLRNPDGTIALTSNDPETGNFSHNLKEGATEVAALQPDLFLDAINAARAMGNEKFDIHADMQPVGWRTGFTGLGPLVFKGKGIDSILMPMRLENGIGGNGTGLTRFDFMEPRKALAAMKRLRDALENDGPADAPELAWIKNAIAEREPPEIGQGPGARTYQPNPIGQGPGGRTSDEAQAGESPESYEGTGLKNAIAELEAEGIGHTLPETDKHEMAEIWEQTEGRTEEGQELADSLIENPRRGLTDEDSALLLRYKVNLFNRLNDAASATLSGDGDAKLKYAALSDKFTDLLDAIKKRGAHWGREGRWRQALANEDYSFASQENLLRASKGGEPLTDTERETMLKNIAEREAKVKELEAVIAKNTKDTAAEGAKKVIEAFPPPPQINPKILAVAENLVRKAEADAALATNELTDLLKQWDGNTGQTQIPQGPGARTAPNSGANPVLDAIVDKLSTKGFAKLSRGLTERGKWEEAMLDEVKDPRIKPLMDRVWKESNAKFDEQVTKLAGSQKKAVKKVIQDKADNLGAREKVVDKIKENVDASRLDELGPLVQQLAQLYSEEGVRGWRGIGNAVHADLRELIPDLDYRETLTAISGHGKWTAPSSEPAKVALREAKSEMNEVLKIQEVIGQKKRQATGFQFPEPSDVKRRLTKVYNEAKKKFPGVEDQGKQLQSALDARKTYYTNRLKDLRFEIAKGQRIVRNVTPPPTDAALDALKAEYAQVKAEHDAIFKDRTITDAQRLKMAIAGVERDIAEYGRKIQQGEFTKAPARKITSPELEALRARRDAAKAQFEELRDLDEHYQEEQHRKGLEAQRRSLSMQIAEQEGRLAHGPEGPAAKPINRPADPILEELMQRRDELNRQLAEARKKPADQKYAEAQARHLEALNKRITERQAKLDARDLSSPARPVNRPLPPGLEEARQKLDEINKQLELLRFPKKSPEALALAAMKARTAARIAELTERLARGNFSPKPKPAPIIYDAEAIRLLAEKNRIEARFEIARRTAEAAQRPPFIKVLEAYSKWRRFLVLTSPAIFKRLISAAAIRQATMPAEQLFAAKVLGNLPVLRDVAARSPLYGQFSLGNEVKAQVAGWTEGVKDAYNKLTTGETSLDAILGKGKRGFEGEPTAIEPRFLQYAAWTHGAMKASTFRVAYTRALEYIKAFDAQRGLPMNELEELRQMNQAYQFAERQIFLQDSWVTDAYRRALSRLNEQGGRKHPGLKIIHTLITAELPIVKVPTNILGESLEYIYGSVTGSVNLGRAIKNGINDLPEDQADLILRQLAKGLLGLGAATLVGYFLRDKIGGFFTPHEKRKTGAAKAGELVNIMGYQVSDKDFHSPWVMALMYGATIGHVADEKLGKRNADKRGLWNGFVAANLGLADTSPYMHEIEDIANLRDPSQINAVIGRKLESYIIPSGVSWIARETDKPTPFSPYQETIKRNPKTLADYLGMGIPGVRNTIPPKPAVRY